MLKRWLLVTLALVPVTFLPACVLTREALRAMWRTPVRGEVTTTFPILTLAGAPGAHSVGIVPYVANDSKRFESRLRIPDNEREAIRMKVARLTATGLQQHEGQHIRALVDIASSSGSLQRVHVTVHREMAMGTLISESWYDTDGARVVPLYEREYSPSWTAIGSAIVSAPLSLLIAGAFAAPMVRRERQSLSSPRPANVRSVVLFAMVAVAFWYLDDPAAEPMRRIAYPAAWMVFWAAVAYGAWFAAWSRKGRVAFIAMLIAIATAAFVMEQPDEAAIVAAGLALLVASAIGIAALIERSLAAAFRAASLSSVPAQRVS